MTLDRLATDVDVMTIEVLVDENGTILALSTAHEGKEPARRRAREQRDEEGVTLRRANWRRPFSMSAAAARP